MIDRLIGWCYMPFFEIFQANNGFINITSCQDVTIVKNLTYVPDVFIGPGDIV